MHNPGRDPYPCIYIALDTVLTWLADLQFRYRTLKCKMKRKKIGEDCSTPSSPCVIEKSELSLDPYVVLPIMLYLALWHLYSSSYIVTLYIVLTVVVYVLTLVPGLAHSPERFGLDRNSPDWHREDSGLPPARVHSHGRAATVSRVSSPAIKIHCTIEM